MVTRLEMAVDKLDGQLIKRRKELTDIRLMSLSSSGSHADTLRRAGHVMAYAHWEGFSKFAFGQYLEYLCDARVPVDLLKIQLRALNYWDVFKSVAAAVDFGSVVTFLEAFGQAAVSNFTVEVREVTKTGNLDSKKFHAFLDLCALEYKPIYQTRKNFIDQVLCGRRHLIAHGLLVPVSSADLIAAIDGAMELCGQVNEQIQEALIYGQYMDNPRAMVRADSPDSQLCSLTALRSPRRWGRNSNLSALRQNVMSSRGRDCPDGWVTTNDSFNSVGNLDRWLMLPEPQNCPTPLFEQAVCLLVTSLVV